MSSHPPDSTAERPTLTDFLRTRTKFVIDPIVTFLARFHLSPDTLTIVGMLAHGLLAWLIAGGEFRWAAVAIILIAPLDALDGALARKLGQQSGGFGAFLDSTLDRMAEIILFGGFLWYYSQQGDTTMMLVAYIAITGSLMVSYTRSRAEALGASCKVGILSRLERYVVLVATLFLNQPMWGLILLAIFTYITVAQRVHHVWKQLR